MKIGVFDSGIGGLSVAMAIEKALPEHEVVFQHDTAEHFPYAAKSQDEIYGFVVPIFTQLIDDGCNVIVVACNTVTTTLIGRLRERFEIPLVGIEPMVKPAAEQTKTGIVTVCATPTTLASARYAELKQNFAVGTTIIEPDCSEWSSLIEKNQMSEAEIRMEILPTLAAGSDVIVLGCTHYHWIEEEIRRLVGRDVIVMQPEQAVIARLKRVLAQLS